MKHDIAKLPKWVQQHIHGLEERVRYAEATIPWTKKGMQWFTLFHPDYRVKGDKEIRRLFTLSESGAHCVCDVGPEDCIFIGRGVVSKDLHE